MEKHKKVIDRTVVLKLQYNSVKKRLEEENCNMAIRRVKLDYKPAVSKTPPMEKIAVPSSHMEELDRAIRIKVRQNEAERAASMEVAGRYVVR